MPRYPARMGGASEATRRNYVSTHGPPSSLHISRLTPFSIPLTTDVSAMPGDAGDQQDLRVSVVGVPHRWASPAASCWAPRPSDVASPKSVAKTARMSRPWPNRPPHRLSHERIERRPGASSAGRGCTTRRRSTPPPPRRWPTPWDAPVVDGAGLAVVTYSTHVSFQCRTLPELLRYAVGRSAVRRKSPGAGWTLSNRRYPTRGGDVGHEDCDRGAGACAVRPVRVRPLRTTARTASSGSHRTRSTGRPLPPEALAPRACPSVQTRGS